MDACRRVASVLLLLVWAVVGAMLPTSGPIGGREAVAVSTVNATSWHRPEGETKCECEAAVEKALGGGDDLGLPPWLTEIGSGHDGGSAAAACMVADRRASERSPLAGQPRGPPSLA